MTNEHEHVFAPVTHQTVAPNKTTKPKTKREAVAWSQCRICGKAETKRPAEAPPVKKTVHKGEAPS